MNSTSSEKSQGTWAQIARVFPLLSGGVLLALALFIFTGVLTDSALLPPKDAFVQTSRDNILLVLASASLAISLVCLCTRNIPTKLLLTAWLGMTCVLYGVGLHVNGLKSLNAYWTPLEDAFRVPAASWTWFIQTYFVSIMLGSAVLLVKGWLTKGAIYLPLTEDSSHKLKIPCPSCRGNISFEKENVGWQISCPRCQADVTLRQPNENLKICCYFCKEHIAFPAHARGTKQKCPHCSKEITLKEIA